MGTRALAALRGASVPRPARVFTDVCRAGSCPEPGRCGSWGICLPASAAAPAQRPSNGAETFTFRAEFRAPPERPPAGTTSPPSSPPPTAGDAGGLAQIVLDPVVEPARPGRSGGCAGCASARKSAGGGVIGAAAAIGAIGAVGAIALRRAARRRRR
jgi:hypothetical protein